MTLPAHRFEERKKKNAQRTITVDFDETITQAPKVLAYVASALKAAGARIVIVTGNSAKRSELEARLEGYDFPWDDLIQYEDNESAGIRRAEILDDLDAFLGIDDRAGRAPTLTKVCPHLFLAARPPKEAKQRAKEGEPPNTEAQQQLTRAAPSIVPPHYRLATEAGLNCKSCIFDADGRCRKYHDYPVDPQHVCDSWEYESKES